MHRLLIPLLACLFVCTPALMRAQVPHEIKYPAFDPNKVQVSANHPDAPCGNAGTYTFGQFLGSSNDVAPEPIYLCFGDSLLVQHNGDADLSGDPIPGTVPGVAYAFYTCPPTANGPTLQDIIGNAIPPIAADACLENNPPSANGMYQTQAVPNGGGTWFFNSGALQTFFNLGAPLSLYFAPITVDEFASNNYETNQPGFPPGPCVAVNTAAAFQVIYLNEITATGISNSFGNDCLGRFTVRGGFPQYDKLIGGNTAVYTIDISLASDPTVKAIIHTSVSNLFHLASVAFSVPVAGLYNVVITDGKSCPASFQIDMNVCDPVDNIVMSMPDTIIPPGTQLCVPVTVQNFSTISASFSVEWDELVLQYDSLTNINPIIAPFFGPAELNSTQTANGLLGVSIAEPTGSIFTIPNDSILFEVCYTAIGQLGECSIMDVSNGLTGISFQGTTGELALSVDTGQICISFLPLNFTYSVIDTTCLGEATLLVTPTGGVEPYDILVMETTPAGPGPNYSGTVSNSGGTFAVPNVGSTNNTAYSYNICVTDNNGQGAMQCTTIVVDIKRLGAQINFAQQPLCNGQTNGIINAVVLQGGVTVNNPGPNYTFNWSGSVPSPGSQVQNGVGAGPYSVTVTDTNTGCSDVASGTLGQPGKISSQSVFNTPASCSGVCNGVITYDAEGGTPLPTGYQYTWIYENTNATVGTGTGDPIILNNACAGEYRVQITDANGCMFIDSNLVLADLRELTINSVVTNVACNGQTNGSVVSTVSESLPTAQTYTFTWTAPGFTQVNASPVSTYSNLPAGIYSVLATDALGCKISDTVQVFAPPVLDLDTLAVVLPGCSQVNSGSICVQAFGGTGGFNGYVYTWSQAGATNNNCQSGLPPATYTVTVTDQKGCKDSLLFVLPVPTPPAFTSTIINEKCGGDGALTVNAPTAIVFVWTDINGVVIDSTASIDSLFGGDYIIKIWDPTGCFATDTFTVNGVTPMSFSNVTLKEPTCFGYNDGQIAIGVQDGTPPYVNYTWNPVQSPSGSIILALKAGTYAVTVTDNAGCTLTGSYQLAQPPAIVNNFSATVVGRVSCFGVCDGDATPLTAYTNGPGDFNYLWKDGSSDSLRTDLCAGLNIVTITDSKNCFIIDTVLITTPTEIGFSNLNTNQTLCYGDSTGSASITGTGGNGAPYTYLWNWKGTTTSNISGIPAGVYTVTITDKSGCTNSIDTINIGQPAQIGLTTSFTNPTCFGGENGQASVDVLGGVPTYQYDWEDFTGDNVGTAATADMLAAGTYTVTVTDQNGCTSSANATVVDPPAVIGTYEPLVPLSCNGDETILNILSISGGSGGPFSFSVDFGAVLDPNFPVSIGGGVHYITYIDVKDCSITDSIFVAEPTPITVAFDPSVIEIELGATADLEPIITGAAVIADFTWTNPQALLNPDSLNATSYTFNNITYTLTVVDSFGCSGSGSVTVNIDPNRNVYIPNVFIPANPSGLNDHFNVNTGLGVEVINFFRIYDRWGELMYEREKYLPNNDNLSEGWDGRYNGDFVNPGVFIYIAEVKFLDGRVLLYRGDVTVVR